MDYEIKNVEKHRMDGKKHFITIQPVGCVIGCSVTIMKDIELPGSVTLKNVQTKLEEKATAMLPDIIAELKEKNKPAV